MTPLDLSTMTPEEVEREAKRRLERRAAGLPLTESQVSESLRVMHGKPESDAIIIPGDVRAMLAGARGPSTSGAFRHVSEPTPKFIVELPWDLLVSDNVKYQPSTRRVGARIVSRQVLTPAYRQARRRAQAEVTAALRSAGLEPPIFPRGVRLAFRAVVFEPDRSRDRDIVNFAKLVQDALSKLVYWDDSQIDDARWIRSALPEPIRPHLEIAVWRIG